MSQNTISSEEVPSHIIENARKIGNEIQAIMQKIETEHKPFFSAANSETAEQTSSSFLAQASDDLKAQLQNYDLEALENEGNGFCTINTEKTGLMTSKFGCGLCTTGLYVGIAAAIGSTVILSGGMSIAAVAAAAGYSVSGLAVVISALTGVSVGAVTALLTAAGTSLGLVVLGLCEAMGKC